MKRARITIDVTVEDNADLDSVAERVFDLVGSDPDHLIDEIYTVDNFNAEFLE